MSVTLLQQGGDLLLVWKQRRFHLDGHVLIAAVGLLLLGLIMVSSASLHLGEKLANDAFYYPKRQLAHALLGCVMAIGVAWVPLQVWEQKGQTLFLIGLLFLVLVLVPGLGREVNGSSRWLVLGGVRIQVSEMIKLISVLFMAGYMERRMLTVRNSVWGMVRPLGLLGVACVLLLAEPDFGAAVVIMSVALGMMFLGGARLWQFALLLSMVGIAGVILIYTSPYRLVRVMSFLDPWADPLNTGFQLTQALIAFGRGEWFGVGLGASVQKLFYLPEAHTDFLFSVIGEELGLAGDMLVIGLFSYLLWRAFAIGRAAEIAGLRFAAFLAYGLGLWFGIQSFINMGVNMGILPTKGLTLPLMSYGGGSIIVMCMAVAILLRVHHEVAESRGVNVKGKTVWQRA
ncbi:MAG: putative lipid II flippase FtsW [Methylococcaceae bacterium]|nr:MAG: putative lipid II flippase FtsW [Methylococcaceae bacterium]